jgi:hypothetical protein
VPGVTLTVRAGWRVEFVLAATGRAEPSPLGLDESVYIYG